MIQIRFAYRPMFVMKDDLRGPVPNRSYGNGLSMEMTQTSKPCAGGQEKPRWARVFAGVFLMLFLFLFCRNEACHNEPARSRGGETEGSHYKASYAAR